MRKLQKEVVSNATNKDFFNLFFKSQNVTRLIGFFGQFISGLTEFHFIFSGVGGVYVPLLKWSNVLPFLFGCFIVYILEVVGVRVFLVRIVRQIANKQFKTRESVVLFGFNLLFVLALCGANLLFSWIGQKATFATKTNVTTTDKTHTLELEKNAKLDSKKYHYDTLGVNLIKTLEREKTSITKRYDSDIKELKNSRYTHRENKTKYDSYTAKIDTKLSDKSKVLADLTEVYKDDKEQLKKDLKGEILTITNSYDKRINDIEKTEKGNVSLWVMVQKYTLPILMVFILLSWVAIIYTEVFYKGSGQKIEIKKVSSRPLLLWVLMVGLYDNFYHWLYGKVVNKIGLDKRHYTDIRINEIKVNPNELLNLQPIAAKQTTNNSTIRQIGFNRNEINETINNTPTTNPNNITNSKTAPFEAPNNVTNTSNDYRITKVVGQDNTNVRTCKNCNINYVYKHHKQLYCSDKCRIQNWEKRTGKKLKKKSKK